MTRRNDDTAEQLSGTERDRLRRRDKRRTTAMVVDNGAVKQIQLALNSRLRPRRPPTNERSDRPDR